VDIHIGHFVERAFSDALLAFGGGQGGGVAVFVLFARFEGEEEVGFFLECGAVGEELGLLDEGGGWVEGGEEGGVVDVPP
jgi:hypothetical protein